jgi:predicted  nucleic acid-binding Zn-ribbon protein
MLFNISFASYQEVRIGMIDDYYKDKISKEQLRTIINEIEYTFESQLNMNIFDYLPNGKDIDILYVTPSKLEQRISSKIEKLVLKQDKIQKNKALFPTMQEDMNILQNNYNEQSGILNKKVKILNNYVLEINKKKSLSKNEYAKIQDYVKAEKKKIDLDIKELKSKQRELTKSFNSYNQKIFSYNNLINESNRLSAEIESMSSSFKKIRGKTFGEQNIILKTYYKDGVIVKEKNITNSMNKIEIYGFDNLKQLKVVLAHEIAHLVGVPHIEAKNALMNPILEQSQQNELVLTHEDIQNFKENF